MRDNDQLLQYLDDLGLLRAALTFTESVTGFSARLVEKDYYCSLLLHDFALAFQQGMVFKGGTCLSKVYADFYRFSEDLDFVIPIKTHASRSERRTLIAPFRDYLTRLPDRLPCFHIAEPLQGFNLSKQYIGRYAYHSQVTGQDEFIKVEIGLREPLFDPIESRLARTMLIDPFRNLPALVSVAVNVMSLRETYAEKFRAALTRKEPAIRDFYDIAYAIRTRRLNLNDTRLVTLIREKLTVPDNTPVDISEAKLSVLRRQLEPQLQPVLRGPDYENFDLEHAFGIVVQLATISLHL